jgi:glycerophosphoryl diester phosphodiesterase
MLETRRQFTGKVSIIGHRGAPACAPENTLASFQEGVRQGADIIELDVQLSADGQAVVFHDDQLDRTTDAHGPLAERTLAELKTLDAGSWFDPRFAGESIPTLDEVLAWARDRVPLFIELKYSGPSDPALGTAVIQRIVAHRMLSQVMVISFQHQALYWVKRHVPDLATGALYWEPIANPVSLAREIGAAAIMPLWHLVSDDVVSRCHSAGLSVSTWGPSADYPSLANMGVDCVSADDPAQVRRDYFEGQSPVVSRAGSSPNR